MAQERWTRKCQECGWVEPDGSYPSQAIAERKAYASFDKLEPVGPRCPECSSLNVEGVLVAETPEA